MNNNLKTFITASLIYVLASTAYANDELEKIKQTASKNLLRTNAFAPLTIKSIPVKGYYALYKKDADIAPVVIDKDGTVMFVSSWTDRNNRTLSPQEQQHLRMDILGNLEKDKLIKRVYGNGKKEILIISAVDCGFCKKLEQDLAQNAKKVNATVYLAPTTLNAANKANADLASRIWCAKDSTRAWENWMISQTTPNSTQCERNYYDTVAIMGSISGNLRPTYPALFDISSGERKYYKTTDDLIAIFN